jgi:hypothetical protein
MRRDSVHSKNVAEVAGMRPIFQPRLINGPFADPGLFVDLPAFGYHLLAVRS